MATRTAHHIIKSTPTLEEAYAESPTNHGLLERTGSGRRHQTIIVGSPPTCPNRPDDLAIYRDWNAALRRDQSRETQEDVVASRKRFLKNLCRSAIGRRGIRFPLSGHGVAGIVQFLVINKISGWAHNCNSSEPIDSFCFCHRSLHD